MKSQKITLPKVQNIKRSWYEIDASKATYGRVATEIANLLRGKLKRDFTPHMDQGDFVVAINADKLKFSGRKLDQKKYYHHSGYLGGLHVKNMKDVYLKNPEEILRKAVFNMLDNLRFRKTLMSRLKLVKGSEHNFKIDKKLS
jgi:large subunit ribosomal protein L13